MSNNKMLRRSLAPLLAALILASGATSQQQRKAKPPKSLRLYVFDGGSLNIPDTAPYRLKKEDIATNYMSEYIQAFLGEAIEGIEDAGLRESLMETVAAWLSARGSA